MIGSRSTTFDDTSHPDEELLMVHLLKDSPSLVGFPLERRPRTSERGSGHRLYYWRGTLVSSDGPRSFCKGGVQFSAMGHSGR